jgi:hypothetical protein
MDIECFCYVLDEYEIIDIINDSNGMISHCSIKGYGIQPVAIIEKLILEYIECYKSYPVVNHSFFRPSICS